MKESFWKLYSFSFGYDRFFNGFGDIILFVDIRGVSFEVDIFAVQLSFRFDAVYFAVRANYTNFDIIPKLKPIYYIFNDQKVFVFLRINGEISKDVACSFINYKDYLSDYPSIVLIVVPTFL